MGKETNEKDIRVVGAIILGLLGLVAELGLFFGQLGIKMGLLAVLILIACVVWIFVWCFKK